MTISVTSLTSGGTTTDASSYTTASITPSANKPVFLCTANRSDNNPLDPVASGCNLTWELVQKNNDSRVSVFMGIGSSPSTGVLTIDYGITTLNCVWSVFELTNANIINGTVVQKAINNGSATSGSITLGTFENVANATLGIFSHNANEATTPGTGFTEIHDVSQSADNISLETEFRSDNDTDVDASWATSSAWRGVAIELRDVSVIPSNGAFLSLF